MIELRDISKRYGDVVVYEHLNLAFAEGKITCILGESGSGKTTLLNILAGLTDYDGELSKKREYAYIFQQPRLVPCLTVRENLRLVCKDEPKIAEIIKEVELEAKVNSYPIELSGGQAQRVSIARAFIFPSELLLMDEPFASLDTALKIRLIDVFCKLWKKEKKTVIFVTHDVEEAYMLSHRSIILRGGNIIADLDAESIDVPRPYGAASRYRSGIVEAMLSK